MTDRRVIRSKTRAVRRLMESRSCEEDETDTSTSDHNTGSPPTVRLSGGRCRGGGGYCSDSAAYNHTIPRLPPIGVFWDIENCQIPRGKSAVAVAQVIRDQFFSGYRESEFVVVCDVKRESPQVIQELDNAQVNVIHVGSQSKNAADEKLRQSIRRFADIHGSLAAIVLISGDINFAPDLCDLRHRKKIHVILVHNDNCSESLIMCASETYSFSALVAGLPLRGAVKAIQQAEVTVSGLPIHYDPGKVRVRLKRLAENCGGRVGLVVGALASVRFPSMEFAIRAHKRMDGEDVFGSPIVVSYPSVVSSRRPNNDLSPTKGFNRKMFSNGYRNEDRKNVPVLEDARSFWKTIPPFVNNDPDNFNNGCFKQPFPVAPFYNQENVPNCMNSKFNESSWENIQNKQPTVGRPILGRQHGYEPNYSNGRHSLDSMLDFEVVREGLERERLSNSTFENWQKNGLSQLGRKCCTPSPISVLGVNTTIPPPPIVNLPRRNDSKYFFHPIDTYNSEASGHLQSYNNVTNGYPQSYKSVTNGHPQSFNNVTNGHPQSSPSPSSSNDGSEPTRCIFHSRTQSADCSLVNVTVRLGDFSARLMALVTSHGNKLPLASLRDCYEAQFEPMVSDSHSVTLEHLVTCVCSVELVKSTSGKYLRLTTNVSPTFTDTQILDAPLAQFSKEIQDLLKNQPKCELALGQLVSAYYRCFGRHCSMADYGCTKLVQLLEKLPNIVQVMGEGASRVVTLTHRSQMQHFTADLTRVLRSQARKQLTLSKLSQLWINTLGHSLEPTDYGMCFLEDLIDLVPTSSAIVNGETISLPQKVHKALRIDQFVHQVIELLSTTGNFTMEFSKFCPAYHQHFGVQCKLSDYGFAKLVQLFEAIPHIVTIEGEMESGRRVSLTIPERLKVLSSRVLTLVQPRFPPGLYVDALFCAYLWQYGYALRLEDYGCSVALELVDKLTTVKIVTNAEGKPIIVPAVDESAIVGNQQEKYFNQPKTKESEVKVNAEKVKTVGTKSVSSALLHFLKKTQNCSAVENGANNPEICNNVKPLTVPEPVVTLLSPAEFLLPPTNSKSPTSQSVFPSSPDPSALPKPIGLAFSQVSNGFDLGCDLLEDTDLNEQTRRNQRLKLAPQFSSPLQLK